MDRLDRLTQRLLDDLDREAPESGSCLAPALLEEYTTGHLDPRGRERVDAHLNACLACLNRVVELRDAFHGLAAPGPVSPRLTKRLTQLIGHEPAEPFWRRVAESLRRAFVVRIPAWAVAGMAAAIMVLTWTAVHTLRQPGSPIDWPLADPTRPDRLKPAFSQGARTVSGVVSSVRDATSNGVEAHVVSLKDAAGATYVLFAWGRPTVGPGDAVEIDGIVTGATESAGHPVYQGVATQVRRAR